MKKQNIYFLLTLVIIGLTSCRKDAGKAMAEQIVNEWIGKEVIFPTDIRCTYMHKDTVCPDTNKPYKILLYTDSIGCTSCKLQLYKWNSLMEEANRLMSDQVCFLFYFHPKDEQELQLMLRREDFKQPVFVDNKNKFDMVNKFPDNINYQCFLLDKNNKVVLVGNPAMNPQIWTLYKLVIMEEENIKEENTEVTTIEVVQSEIELDGLKIDKSSTAVFVLKNTGNVPLVIKDITATCGCTVPEWDRQPIKPGESTEIKVKVTPDISGYFRKTITVFCNIQTGSLSLVVKSMIKE